MKTKDEQEVQLKTKLEEAAKDQESMRASKSSTEKDLQDSREQCSDLDKMVQKLQRQVSQLSQDKDRLQEQYQSAQTDVTTAEQSGDDWKAKYKDSLKKSQADAHDIAELKQKLHDAVEDKKSMQSKEQLHQTALATVVQESDEWKKRFETSVKTMEDKTKEIIQVRQLLYNAESEKQDLQIEYDAMETRLWTVVQESRELEKEFQTSLKTIQDKARENALVKQLLDNADNEKQGLQNEANEMKARLATAVQERINWQDKFKSSESKLQAELDRTAQLKRQLDNTEHETRRLQEERDHMTDSLATAVQDCNEWKNKYETSRNDLPEQTGGDAELHQKLATATQEVERLESRARSSHNTYTIAREQYHKLERQLKTSEIELRGKGDEVSKLKQQLQVLLAVDQVPPRSGTTENSAVADQRLPQTATGVGLQYHQATKTPLVAIPRRRMAEDVDIPDEADDDDAVLQEVSNRRKRVRNDPTVVQDSDGVMAKRARSTKSNQSATRASAARSRNQPPNNNTDGYIAIDDLRDPSVVHTNLPVAVLEQIRKQMRSWDRIRPDWGEGSKRGDPKCAHRFANHQGSGLEGPYACVDCTRNHRVCLALRANKVRALPLAEKGPSVTEVDVAYWKE
ncbi:MAG: hypothetical protein L6R42_000332 [Xanthoria sp. 1 TBL-2021]|nr:MAG: hypothetical protein L6R42_000332 [Xanthoria sp. 1 TBL-2021]